MGKIKLKETYTFEINIKLQWYASGNFDTSSGIEAHFFRVPVTIEPGRYLLTVSYHKLFEISQ